MNEITKIRLRTVLNYGIGVAALIFCGVYINEIVH